MQAFSSPVRRALADGKAPGAALGIRISLSFAFVLGRRRVIKRRRDSMTITVAHITPIVALIAGILILAMPRLLNYVVAAYLIIVGILGLTHRM
jgi:hypothetical protein